jgi:lipopolysaccharide export system permease protein
MPRGTLRSRLAGRPAMNILTRYIATSFVRYWLGCVSGLLGLILISALLGNVSDAFQSLPAFLRFCYETIQTLPGLMEILLPMTVLLATVFTFAGFSRTSELVAMKAAGMGFARLLRPLAGALLAICAFAYLNQNYLFRFLHPNDQLRAAEERHQWRDLGDAIVYVNRIDPAASLVLDATVFRWQAAPFRMTQLTLLPEGRREPGLWTFERVRVREKQPALWTLRTAQEVRVPDAGFPDVFKPRDLDAHHLPLEDLYQEITERKSRPQPGADLMLEVLRKLAVFTAPLVMVLIGAPLSQFHFRGGRVAGEVLVTLLVGLVFMLSSEIFFILAKGGLLYPWVGALGVNLAFAAVGFGLFRLSR